MTEPLEIETERSVEVVLRPKNLGEFVGQENVVQQLSLLLTSAKKRGEPPDHILFSGPPGLGKTTLATITAAQAEVNLRITSGPTLTHAGDLVSILSSLNAGEILFIDEIHRMSKPAQEILYIAMEDFRVDVVVGKGIGATSIALPLPHFTVIGATTRSGLLPTPLRDRFGFNGIMDFYTPADLARIVKRSAKLLDIIISHDAAEEIGRRSRGTARIANRILRRVRDWAQVHGNGTIDIMATQEALKLYQIDDKGLDKLDRQVIEAIIRRFSGGPVGIATLSTSIGEEAETIEAVVEPFLVREGFIARTKSGRIATKLAYVWYNNYSDE